MIAIVRALLAFITSTFHSRLAMQFEILALRHQLTIYQRATRPRIEPLDRLFWSWLSKHWTGWRGRFGYRKTSHGDHMATKAFSGALGKSVPEWKTRTASGGQGNPGSDPENVDG